MIESQPVRNQGESGPSKILIGVAFLALCFVGFVFYWTSRPVQHWDFESLYDEPPTGAKRVLWVGNSHMWWHDMPVMMQKMVPEGQPPMWFELHAQPGVQTVWHNRGSSGGKAALSQKWDVIMLQPQSVEAVTDPDVLKQGTLMWQGIAKESGAELFVWSTWGRDPNNDGYNVYSANWSGGNLAELTKRIETNTIAAAGDDVCPIGAAWLHAHNKHPKAPLWAPQMGNHASVVGTYLANSMVYACIWKRDPREITFVPAGLSDTNAENLRIAAWETAVMKGVLEGELPAGLADDESEGDDVEPDGEDAEAEEAPE